MKKLMNLKEKVLLFIEKYKKVLITLIFILIFLPISKQFFYFSEIKKNKKETIGVISKIKYTSRGDNSLYYYYMINGKKYEGITSVNSFYGYNKKKGCVGCEFKIYYSSKNPNKSTIRLDKYEKYKRTVEFGLFDD